MKKILLLILLGIMGVAMAQNKIVVAKYTLFPYSDEYLEADANKSQEEKDFSFAMRNTLEYHYTLMIDEAKKQAVFYKDTLITRKIKGKEEYWTEAENQMPYAFKKDNKFYAKEKMFSSELYLVANQSFNYQWEIQSDTKTINGISCQKAVSNIKGNKVIAWFTKEVPVSYGPLNYWGLPGLIVKVENYFNTITLTGLEYAEDATLFNEKLNLYEKEYNAEKKSSQTELYPYLLRKASLIKRLKLPR